jgi:uncharacterized membrane protein
MWDRALNSGLYVCKANSLPLKPHLHFFAVIILGYVFSGTICPLPKALNHENRLVLQKRIE